MKHRNTKLTKAITLAVSAFALLGAVSSAEARDHRDHREYRSQQSSSHIYVSGHRSCGTPIYTEKYIIGHDRRGYPVWRYRTVAAPRHYRGGSRSRYHAAPAYPSRHSSYGGYRNGGRISIRGGYCR